TASELLHGAYNSIGQSPAGGVPLLSNGNQFKRHCCPAQVHSHGNRGDLAMSASITSLSASQQRRRKWESRFAGPMFFLAILFLIVLAGLLHRFPRLEWPDPEMKLILAALGGLWLVFILEAGLRILIRDRSLPARSALIAAAVFGLLPPLR